MKTINNTVCLLSCIFSIVISSCDSRIGGDSYVEIVPPEVISGSIGERLRYGNDDNYFQIDSLQLKEEHLIVSITANLYDDLLMKDRYRYEEFVRRSGESNGQTIFLFAGKKDLHYSFDNFSLYRNIMFETVNNKELDYIPNNEEGTYHATIDLSESCDNCDYSFDEINSISIYFILHTKQYTKDIKGGRKKKVFDYFVYELNIEDQQLFSDISYIISKEYGNNN